MRWVAALAALGLLAGCGSTGEAVSAADTADRADRLVVEPGDTVFLGDSITMQGPWADLFPERPVRNLGISGNTSDDVLGRLDPVLRGRPHEVFLLIGSNDLRQGRGPEHVVRNAAEILDRIRAATPSTELVLESIIPRDVLDADEVRAANAGLRQVAADRGFPFVDLWPGLDDGSGRLEPELTYDGSHLVPPAYEVVAAHVAPLVG